MKRAQQQPDSFLILGHRGSPRRQAENSLQGLALALEDGADGCETDLRMTADGVVVLYHDAATPSGRRVDTLELQELIEETGGVTTLGQLNELPAQSWKILEIKAAEVAQKVLPLTAGWQNVIISSFDHRIVRELARLRSPHPLGIVLSGWMLDVGRYAANVGACWLFADAALADEAMVADCRSERVGVIPWTVNSIEEAERLRAAGCAGVITDIPEELTRWKSGP
jgi:glycerophosphoryl diester phosphodiesterase